MRRRGGRGVRRLEMWEEDPGAPRTQCWMLDLALTSGRCLKVLNYIDQRECERHGLFGLYSILPFYLHVWNLMFRIIVICQ